MLDFPPLLPTGGQPLASVSPRLQDIMLPGEQGFSQPGSSRLESDFLLGDLQSWARSDMDRWDTRNARFDRDQELYRLAPPPQMPRNSLNLVTLNDPRTLVDKVVRIMSRHPNILDIQAKPGADPMIAQKMENALYDIDRAINHKWVSALNNPYRYDQAFSATLRGWICSRTMLQPENLEELATDPSAIWNHEIVDPANVYPYKAGGKIRRVTHAYQTSVGDMVRDPLLYPFLDPDWFDQDDRSLCHVTAIYWQAQDGGWYHAIIGGVGPGSGLSGQSSMWIKAPVELGYNPWTIILCGGAGYRETPWDDQEFIEMVGTGILDPLAENQKYLNRMVTRLNELLAQESNPAVSFFSASGKMMRVDITAGARNYLMKDDKVELHRVGPDQRDFQPLWDIFKQRHERGGIPDSFFGDIPGENGLAAAQLMAAGRDVLYPYSEGINMHDALKYRLMLELYRDFGPGVPLPTKIEPGGGLASALNQFMGQQAGMPGQAPGMGMMPGMMPGMMGGMGLGGGIPGAPGMGMPPDFGLGTVFAASLDAWEITQQGCFVEVTREDMTPQEIAARVNLALAMVKDQVLSRDTARREWVKLRNPKGEDVKILGEMAFQNPQLVQMLIPMALAANGDTRLLQLWEMSQSGMLMGGLPGGAPQTPGAPQGGSNPNGNLPTQVAAPAANGNLLANTRVAQMDPEAALLNDMLAQLTGGATGGAGMGGSPPPGGQQGSVQPTPPPGRRGF